MLYYHIILLLTMYMVAMKYRKPLPYIMQYNFIFITYNIIIYNIVSY